MSRAPVIRDNALIRMDHVGVTFPLYHGGSRSLKKSLLFRGSGGRIGQDANQRIVVEALRDISLTLKSGDRLALIGSNGAGKTTLLRAMAGIYEPVSGTIEVHGRISPLLDLNLGIDNELTGYDNIRLRALILGMGAADVERLLPEIAAFTELGEYLEMPVRTYSSGMILRLTFAVATCVRPDILLMDEWMLAGDAKFMAKAEERTHSFFDEASIIVLASRTLSVCRRWCNLGLWMEQGRVREFGPVGQVIDSYEANLKAA